VSDPIKSIRFAKGMSQSLCVALMLLTCGALSAQNEEHRIRNIVLVHGAWADGTGWKGVYDILVKDGYNVSIVQEPETSFKDDVAATKRALALQDGPCILVGHSYGGAVITEAGTDSSVAGLVYVAAHMPDAGENKAVITAVAWRSEPSWMVVAGADRTINPDLERWYATRANSHKVEFAGASNSVYVSRPKEVAAVIEEAAAHVH